MSKKILVIKKDKFKDLDLPKIKSIYWVRKQEGKCVVRVEYNE